MTMQTAFRELRIDRVVTALELGAMTRSEALGELDGCGLCEREMYEIIDSAQADDEAAAKEE
jgi:hypothetical protein